MLDLRMKYEKECSLENRKLYEGALVEMYKKTISLSRASKELLGDIANEEVPEKINGSAVYAVDVKSTQNAIIITLDGLMLHRKVTISNNSMWEKEFTDKLGSFVRENNYKPSNRAVVIFQHVFPPESRDSDVYDNDNYQQKESKMILDSIVSSGMIKGDKGTDCFIMHMASYGNRLETRIHVVKEFAFADYYKTLT